MDEKKQLEQRREFMCAHYPLCRGCPIDDAARKVKLSCHVFCKRKPDEVRKIVNLWDKIHGPKPVEE